MCVRFIPVTQIGCLNSRLANFHDQGNDRASVQAGECSTIANSFRKESRSETGLIFLEDAFVPE